MVAETTASTAEAEQSPWPALAALCLGFFMILVDSTIVSVATPVLIEDLDAEVNSVLWVTSAYLLAYAVPVMITGRLGDRYGPKNLYLIGLAIFTGASLWCGLTDTVGELIVARVVQGLGAALLTPQTMAIIVRIFPAERRGRAMALWGATAGAALLAGPIFGGVLVDGLGWQWIFFVNGPIGAAGLYLAWRLVPRLETHPHRFDWLGVALVGVGLFLLVFGIQEGHQYQWSTITGVITVPRMIVAGLVVLAGFVVWQARNPGEPLVPLQLFADRNFSLANLAMSTMSFGTTAITFPFMLHAQLVLGLSPTQSALLFAPMAVMSILLAPWIGGLTDRLHPRVLTGSGYAAAAASLIWLAAAMTATGRARDLILPMVLLGFGNACVWGPTSATATRNLPPHRAGAGAGIYNTTRQMAAVLGSAAIAVLMEARLAAHGLVLDPDVSVGGTALPMALRGAFSQAMAESAMLPAAGVVVGLVAALCFTTPRHLLSGSGASAPGPNPTP